MDSPTDRRGNSSGPTVLYWLRGEPVYDLSGLGLAEVYELLAPLSRIAREASVQRSEWRRLPADGHLILGELLGRDMDLQRAALGVLQAEHPTPAGRLAADAAERELRRSASRQRQVNIKMSDREHTELVRAATLLGLRPTQLARQLMLSGARRIRYEDRRQTQGLLDEVRLRERRGREAS